MHAAAAPLSRGPEPEAGLARLEGRDLVRDYGRNRVVNHVSVTVDPGEVVGLLGPNGAGKTTTFHMIVGLLKPTSGTISLGSADVTHLPMYRRARLGIGYLPQEASVFRKLTVSQNVEAILETMNLSSGERRERLAGLLKELNIEKIADRKAYNLSGGERRRVEITRALAARPRFLLLDEPFVGIDPIAVGDIQEIIAGLKHKGLGILITDHSVRETLSATDRAYLMADGRIFFAGTAREVSEDPMSRSLYLGDKFKL